MLLVQFWPFSNPGCGGEEAGTSPGKGSSAAPGTVLQVPGGLELTMEMMVTLCCRVQGRP